MLTTVPWRIELGDRVLDYQLVVDSDGTDALACTIVDGSWRPSPAMLWMLNALHPGDRLVDLGAHIGTFSLAAASAGASVLSIEASPRNANLLRQAIAANGFDNVEVFEAAVDAAPGRIEFAEIGPFGSISLAGENEGMQTVTVDAVTLDQIPGRPYTWAKIDIEGAEIGALKGGAACLREIQHLVIESNGHTLASSGSSPPELVALLRDNGFKVFEAEADSTDLRPVGRRVVQPETVVDYIAVRGELPVPTGYRRSGKRSGAAVAALLRRELNHPQVLHRRYAHAAVKVAPWHIRRRAMREDEATTREFEITDATSGIAELGGRGYATCQYDGFVFLHRSDDQVEKVAPNSPVTKRIVGVATTATGQGHWLAAEDGEVFAFGDAVSFGGATDLRLNAPIVGIQRTPDAMGYWLVAADGGVFCFGSAQSWGSRGGKPLKAPVVGMATTATGDGYWLATSAGEIFSFGDALAFDTAELPGLDGAIVGIARTPTGAGCWLAGADGRVVGVGDGDGGGDGPGLVAPADGGSAPPTVGIAAARDEWRYWLVNAKGGVKVFAR